MKVIHTCTEGDELGLAEVVGQFTSQESGNKTQDGQKADIPKGQSRTLRLSLVR